MKRNWIARKYGEMGIKNKTLLFVSIIVACMMFIFAFAFIGIMNYRVRNESEKATKKVLLNTAELINDYFDEVGSIANEANYDYYLQNYLINANEAWAGASRADRSKNMVYSQMSTKLFSSYINNRVDVSSIMVFGEKDLLLHKSIYEYWSYVMNYTDLEWYKGAVEEERKAVVTGPQHHGFLLGNTEKTISVSRQISNCEDGSNLGIMLIDLNLNEVANISRTSFNAEKGTLLLLNKKGDIVYQCNNGNVAYYSDTMPFTQQKSTLAEGLQSKPEGVFMVKQGGEQFQAVSVYCDKPEWTLVALTPMVEITKEIYNMLALIVLLVLLITIIIVFVLNGVLSNIVRPIVELTDHLDTIKTYETIDLVQVNGKDETGRLAASFNKMLKRIHNLMGRLVIEQEEKRKYELQALQAQINPHFLYNTLDSIVWMAELNDPHVIPMTEALAKLFRISLSKGAEEIYVKNELEHVRNYLVIQSMRYENKFTYEINIANDVRECMMLKLIVQPIVENSIYHGMKLKQGKGHIVIDAAKQDEKLIITVSDDGNGMSDEECRNILTDAERFKDTSGSGIGVKNVNERIKLFYGLEYGLNYQSELGKGTNVTITLPVNYFEKGVGDENS